MSIKFRNTNSDNIKQISLLYVKYKTVCNKYGWKIIYEGLVPFILYALELLNGMRVSKREKPGVDLLKYCLFKGEIFLSKCKLT